MFGCEPACSGKCFVCLVPYFRICCISGFFNITQWVNTSMLNIWSFSFSWAAVDEEKVWVRRARDGVFPCNVYSNRYHSCCGYLKLGDSVQSRCVSHSWWVVRLACEWHYDWHIALCVYVCVCGGGGECGCGCGCGWVCGCGCVGVWNLGWPLGALLFTQIKLELTVNRRAHFEGLFRLRLESAACKIMLEKVVGRIWLGLPSFAASCEGRTFGDEKDWKWARCDGDLM